MLISSNLFPKHSINKVLLPVEVLKHESSTFSIRCLVFRPIPSSFAPTWRSHPTRPVRPLVFLLLLGHNLHLRCTLPTNYTIQFELVLTVFFFFVVAVLPQKSTPDWNSNLHVCPLPSLHRSHSIFIPHSFVSVVNSLLTIFNCRSFRNGYT